MEDRVEVPPFLSMRLRTMNGSVHVGGAVGVANGILEIRSCNFTSNTGPYAGAIYHHGPITSEATTTLSVVNTSFLRNGEFDAFLILTRFHCNSFVTLSSVPQWRRKEARYTTQMGE